MQRNTKLLSLSNCGAIRCNCMTLFVVLVLLLGGLFIYFVYESQCCHNKWIICLIAKLHVTVLRLTFFLVLFVVVLEGYFQIFPHFWCALHSNGMLSNHMQMPKQKCFANSIQQFKLLNKVAQPNYAHILTFNPNLRRRSMRDSVPSCLYVFIHFPFSFSLPFSWHGISLIFRLFCCHSI